MFMICVNMQNQRHFSNITVRRNKYVTSQFPSCRFHIGHQIVHIILVIEKNKSPTLKSQKDNLWFNCLDPTPSAFFDQVFNNVKLQWSSTLLRRNPVAITGAHCRRLNIIRMICYPVMFLPCNVSPGLGRSNLMFSRCQCRSGMLTMQMIKPIDGFTDIKTAVMQLAGEWRNRLNKEITLQL